MSEHEESPSTDYPLGRGYGHDYMRGGEVFGGYGYSERQEYELRRGDLGAGTREDATPAPSSEAESAGGDSGGGEGDEP